MRCVCCCFSGLSYGAIASEGSYTTLCALKLMSHKNALKGLFLRFMRQGSRMFVCGPFRGKVLA